jgi:4-carboxymuconolactone decarboxylase
MNTNEPVTTARKALGDFAPKLVELTDKVLFGDVWERPQLSKRDRSLITCAALVAMGKTEQMSFHFPRAIENGVTQEEIVELITHLAFYAGWPNAMSAVGRAKPGSRANAEILLAQLRSTFLPNRILAVAGEGDDLNTQAKLVPLLDNKIAQKGKPTAYVCERSVCELPTTSPDVFARQLRKVRKLDQSGAR